MKPVGDMTVDEFRALPFREDWSKEEEFDALVLLPGDELHDSGYRCIDFVGVRKGVAVCRLAGSSDVLHIDGIGGLRIPRRAPGVVQGVWSIDCLPASGLFRLWTDHRRLRVGAALSSFEVFAIGGSR